MDRNSAVISFYKTFQWFSERQMSGRPTCSVLGCTAVYWDVLGCTVVYWGHQLCSSVLLPLQIQAKALWSHGCFLFPAHINFCQLYCGNAFHIYPVLSVTSTALSPVSGILRLGQNFLFDDKVKAKAASFSRSRLRPCPYCCWLDK